MKATSKRSAKATPSIDRAVVEVAVGDGLLIARSAATIAVANRIILRALREQQAFDHDETAADVRTELGHLAREQEDLASRMVSTRTKALKSRGRSKHQFDYRPDDNSALASRATIYTAIAAGLDELAGDASYVDEIVVAARDRAWNDIGSAVLSQASAAVVVPDADYDSLRDERLHDLLEIDLKALAGQQH